MLLLKKKTFELSSDSPLVKAEDAAAVVKADDIIQAAEQEAERIVSGAKDAYEAEKKRGYDDGIAEGKEEILLQKLDLLDETLSYMEGVEGKLVELVMKSLQKCVAEIGDKELVFQIVRKAMQAIVRTQRQITVKVSPAMVPEVRSRVKELLGEYPVLAEIEVYEDSQLADTACIVETEAGLVEASVDGQIEAIRKSMEKHFKR